jgi:hypothetical protein
LDVIREDAGGQLVELEVIGDTLAALALARAGLIGAVAPGFIGFYVAFYTLASAIKSFSLRAVGGNR